MTPLQVGTYFRLAQKQRLRDRADLLVMYANATRADGKDIQAEMHELIEYACQI